MMVKWPMPRIRTVLIVALIVLSSWVVLPAWAGDFLSVYEDLPLAPGLVEVPGSALSFDSADGRIVEADAKGRTNSAAVLKFYAAALPQLGWTDDGKGRFHRDQESLRIDMTDSAGSVVAHFTISPK